MVFGGMVAECRCLVVFGDLWWYGGVWWTLVVFSGLWWYLVVFGGLSWSLVVFRGLW